MSLELILFAAVATTLIYPAVYLTSRVISTGYFHAKFDYHRKLLNAIDKEVDDGIQVKRK